MYCPVSYIYLLSFFSSLLWNNNRFWYVKFTTDGDKTKCMVMYRDQNAGRNHSVRIDNSTFESVEEFKYLGTTLTNQNSIAEEIKSRLRSGNACCHSVQNFSSSRLVTKNFKKYNFACCFLWVWNLVADIARGKEAEGVWEHGVQENIWTEE